MLLKNKTLTKKQQISKSFRKGIYLSCIFTVIVILAYQLLILPDVRKDSKADAIRDLKNNSKEMKVYVLNKDLAQGQAIDITKDVDYITCTVSAIASDSIVDSNKLVTLRNNIAKIKLNKNMPISSSMFFKNDEFVTSDLRNQDYSHITLGQNLKKGDYVDIRYKKKDGTDYVVAAKKKIIDISGSMFSTNISEDERNYINNVTVVASYTGGTLYTTTYVDPLNQEKAKVTYLLNDSVSKLISSNPDVVKQAQNQIIDKSSSQTSSQGINTVISPSATNTKPQFIEGGTK